jgi:hypothetical protein
LLKSTTLEPVGGILTGALAALAQAATQAAPA